MRYRLISSECPDLQRFCGSLQKKCCDMLRHGCLQQQATGAFSILLSYVSFLPFLIVLLSLDLLKYLSILLSAGCSEAFDNFHGFVFFFFPREFPEEVWVEILAAWKSLIIISLPAFCFQLPTPHFSAFWVEHPRFQYFCPV